MPLINPVVDIALAALIWVVVSQLLRRKLVDTKKLKREQARMKELQKQVQGLLKQNDEKSRQKADELQKEMLELMNRTMGGSMKPLLVTLPIIFVVYWVLGNMFSGIPIEIPFAVPVVHRMAEFPFFGNFEITSTLSWLWWFIYCSILIGIVFNVAIKIIEKTREKTL